MVGERMENTKSKMMNRNHRMKHLKEKVFIWSIWIVPIIIFVMMQLGTSIRSITMAFQEYDVSKGEYYWVGFATLEKVFHDFATNQLIVTSISNSMIIWVVNTFIGIPVHLLVSFTIYKKVYGAEIFRVILFLPNIIAGMVWVLIYSYLVDYGVPVLLGNPDMMSFLKNPSTDFWTLLIYSQWLGFAGGMVIYTGAMSRIPNSIIEYAKLDGLGYVKEFIFITIPLIFPTLSVTLITIATGLFMSGLPLYEFYGEGAKEHLYSISYYMYIMVAGKQDNPVKFPFSAAMSLVVSCVTVPITLLMRHLVEKYGPSVEY